MKKVIAKFKVREITKYESGDTQVKLTPITSYDKQTAYEENKQFWDATPSGNLEMFIAADREAANVFEVGDTFKLEFTKEEITEG